MTCYHPLTGIYYGEKTATGKRKLRIVSGISPMYNYQKSLDVIPIPCGHCIGCRLDYSRSWADRMLLELETMKKGIFLTLTYDNEHAHWSQFYEDDSPMYATLNKRDFQLFIKRLRKKFEGVKIRYYYAGEYGPKTLRPHYHAILFGFGLNDLPDLLPHGRNELGQEYYISSMLSETWGLGYCLCSNVSWKTCAYVSRYVTKKLNGPLSDEYARRNVIPEFADMSRRPGIGKEYLNLHPDCLDYNSINLNDTDGGIKMSIPKYYLKQLELTDPERYANMKEQRKMYAKDNMILKLQKTGLSYLDYLEVEEEKRKQKIKGLKRRDV